MQQQQGTQATGELDTRTMGALGMTGAAGTTSSGMGSGGSTGSTSRGMGSMPMDTSGRGAATPLTVVLMVLVQQMHLRED